MTTTTTALQALRQLIAVVDSDGPSHAEVIRMANGGDAYWAAIRDARAALAAPAPALDAPAERRKSLVDYKALYHDAVADIHRLAARASQPTPAQDAAATVPDDHCRLKACDPETGKEFIVQEGLRSVLQPRLDMMLEQGRDWWIEPPASSSAYEDGYLAGRKDGEVIAQAKQHATPPAPQVAPTAAQPVCYLSSKQLRGIPTGELRGHYIPFSLEREGNFDTPVTLGAPTTPQAPALVPLLADALSELLTDMRIAQANMRRAAKRDPAWEGCAEAIQPRVVAAQAALAAAELSDITPAGTTPKEQQ